VAIIKQWLSSLPVKAFHIESDSTDLRVTPGEHRQWLGISGHNIPSFEIFLSPDWRGTEGVYYADQPSFRSGNYIEKVRLTFKKGSVVNVEAAKGLEFAKNRSPWTWGRGGGRVLAHGQAVFPDQPLHGEHPFRRNFGAGHGNCHLAVGASYSDTYSGDPSKLTKTMKKALGFNDSALHWDLVNTEKKTVTAHLKTGEKVVIYDGGIFRW